MKILLTHAYFLGEDEKEKKIMRPYAPLGILYLSAFLEQNGFNNSVFDTTFKSRETFFSYLQTEKPEIIGIYTNLMTKVSVLQIISYIQQHLPESIIILGGPDVRFNNENYLRHGAHYLVIGEGEQTILELIQHLQHPSDPSLIKGISFLRNGQLITTADREKFKDLDLLPTPARQKIDLNLYLETWKTHHGKSAISVSTMRGCPYTCKWCSRGVYGLSYRRRSPEIVVKELMLVQNEYKPDTIWFVDDVFTISHKWMEGFAVALMESGLKIRYECITRADRMNEHVIKLLKETGCFRVWIGAESGSQKVIDLMDRRVYVGQVREMIRLTRAAGIEAGTFIMLGYPGETENDIKETIRHLKESNPDHFTITVAYPIKGTELFQEVEANATQPDWVTHTDRQIEFKKTYDSTYYRYAVRHVINEVNGKKALDQNQQLNFIKFKVKSVIARLGMYRTRL